MFVDPYVEAEEQLKAEREKLDEKKKKQAADSRPSTSRAATGGQNAAHEPATVFRAGVGKYIRPAGTAPPTAIKRSDEATTIMAPPEEKKRKVVKTALNDFSAW